MVGIYDCFGYGGNFDVPFKERYRLIKLAGFECVEDNTNRLSRRDNVGAYELGL